MSIKYMVNAYGVGSMMVLSKVREKINPYSSCVTYISNINKYWEVVMSCTEILPWFSVFDHGF